MNEQLVIVLAVAALLLAFFVVKPWLVRRALPKVIRIFKEHNATSVKNAVRFEELGIRASDMFDLRFLKDFKKDALDFLLKVDIVQMTEDGRFYLAEDKLNNSKLYKFQSYSRY